MAVGYPLNKPIIDSRVGYLTVALQQTLEGFVVLNRALDRPDPELIEMGYTEADITLLRSLTAAQVKLRNIAHGQDTQPEASDFFFFAPKVTALD